MTITPEIAADAEAVYHELLERLGPAQRAKLVRLLLNDGPQWDHSFEGNDAKLD